MFPGMNPREMQKAMKRLGIRQEEIEAEEVIIKTADKNLVIRNPHVSRINMMGQESIQVVGNIEEVEKGIEEGQKEQAKEEERGISDDDIAVVMEQASCTRERALEALEQSRGNLAEAILKLQK